MAASTQNPNIRISAKSKAVLLELAQRHGKPMQAVLDEAIERYQRDTFLDEANAAYARLRKDAPLWKSELAERELWDRALMDGLENE